MRRCDAWSQSGSPARLFRERPSFNDEFAGTQVDLDFAGPVIAYAWPSLGEQARYAEDRRRCRPGQPAVVRLRGLIKSLLAAVRLLVSRRTARHRIRFPRCGPRTMQH